jgi:hypothetical protein
MSFLTNPCPEGVFLLSIKKLRNYFLCAQIFLKTAGLSLTSAKYKTPIGGVNPKNYGKPGRQKAIQSIYK